MKKILILGASASQVPLIKTARKMGLHTIAASTPGAWPGFNEADQAAYVDISDPEAVLACARENRVDGITTCCLDTGVPAIGLVCEKLGLSGPGWEASLKARYKDRMKEAFTRSGVRTARFFVVHTPEEGEDALEKLGVPVMVKVPDLMGGRGIFRCETPEEADQVLRLCFTEYNSTSVVMEERLTGTLFGAEAMLQNGKLVFCTVNNTEISDTPVPLPVGHTIPFEGGEKVLEEALRQVRLAVSALGIDNCPVNCDLMVSGEEVYVIEMAARCGGTGLPELISEQYRMDYYEALLRLALGEPVGPMFAQGPCGDCIVSHTLQSPSDGVVEEIGMPQDHPDWLRSLVIDVREGDPVRRFRNGRDRIGQVILTGKDAGDAKDHLDKVLSSLHLKVSMGK